VNGQVIEHCTTLADVLYFLKSSGNQVDLRVQRRPSPVSVHPKQLGIDKICSLPLRFDRHQLVWNRLRGPGIRVKKLVKGSGFNSWTTQSVLLRITKLDDGSPQARFVLAWQSDEESGMLSPRPYSHPPRRPQSPQSPPHLDAGAVLTQASTVSATTPGIASGGMNSSENCDYLRHLRHVVTIADADPTSSDLLGTATLRSWFKSCFAEEFLSAAHNSEEQDKSAALLFRRAFTLEFVRSSTSFLIPQDSALHATKLKERCDGKRLFLSTYKPILSEGDDVLDGTPSGDTILVEDLLSFFRQMSMAMHFRETIARKGSSPRSATAGHNHRPL